MARLNSPLNRGEFARKIRAGERVVGSFSGLGTAATVEVMAAAGADFVLIDLEHGSGSEEHVGFGGAAAGAYGTATLVRVEEASRIKAGKMLDAGAAGIMFPRVSSFEHAQELVSYMHYPPQGIRGVATYNRSVRWGLERENLATASEEVVTIVQIETIGALEDVEKIAALGGVDILFVGPLDLSYALGVPLDFQAPVFTQALQRVLDACAKNNKCAGILAANTELAKERARQGFKFVAVGSDSTLLADAVKQACAEISSL